MAAMQVKRDGAIPQLYGGMKNIVME